MNKKGELTIIEFFIIFSIFIAIFIPAFIRPKYEAKLFNEKYKTSYTTLEFMFAGETIKDYVENGKKSTLNLNIK